MLYLVLGIAILGGIGFAFFKLKGKDGKKKSDEDDSPEYTDDDFEYEDEVNEDGDTSEEEK
jgi:hypothetical protein